VVVVVVVVVRRGLDGILGIALRGIQACPRDSESNAFCRRCRPIINDFPDNTSSFSSTIESEHMAGNLDLQVVNLFGFISYLYEPSTFR
jgi:hypothetical protein